MIKLSESSENYLEIIYDLTKKGIGKVSLTEIARLKEVSKPSVNKALNLLLDLKLIVWEPYGKILLTKSGVEHASYMKKRHIGIKNFLIKVLELDEALADCEACRIEHIVSDTTIEKMLKLVSVEHT